MTVKKNEFGYAFVDSPSLAKYGHWNMIGKPYYAILTIKMQSKFPMQLYYGEKHKAKR